MSNVTALDNDHEPDIECAGVALIFKIYIYLLPLLVVAVVSYL